MQVESHRKSNAQRSADMRARLIEAGRALFAEKGYAETGTPEIVKRAEVTRGALYHHFADKTDLFREVFRAEAEQVASEIVAAASDKVDPETALRQGTKAYFEAMRTPGRARILLVDGPVVLGWAEIDAIDAGSGRATLRAGLSAARPDADPARIGALATVLSAAFDRAALAVSSGEDEAPYIEALIALVGGVSSSSGGTE